MKKLTAQQFEQLTHKAKVIEEDSFGRKVLLLPDDSYVKLFRIKRLLTSARLYPYSKRFTRNATILRRLDIPTIHVKTVFNVPAIKRDAVHYAPLAGEVLRSPSINIDDEIAYKLGVFIGKLHDKGVYFRSLHLGNIVLISSSELGLIDIADLKFYKNPLSTTLRTRNFGHLCRYENDRIALKPYTDKLANGYNKVASTALPIATLFS